MLNKDTLLEIQATAIRAVGAFTSNGGEQFIVTPNGEVKSLGHLNPPARVKAHVQMIDAGSFADYVNRFKNPDTVIFADITESGAKLTAIIDYHHAPEEAGTSKPHPEYCGHQATLELTPTVDWKAWIETNGEDNRMSQEQFAVWLEDYAYLFNGVKEGALKGAELLDLVCTLQAKSNVRYNRTIRLQDGRNRLDYEEDVSVQGTISTGVQQGTMEFPPMINAALQPFDGGPTYQVDARLKTRINGRSLAIWYETVQPHKIIRDAIMDTVKQVTEKTGIIPFIGQP
jgi:uncharacterized protein YfdQ (DUF2303 family)